MNISHPPVFNRCTDWDMKQFLFPPIRGFPNRSHRIPTCCYFSLTTT